MKSQLQFEFQKDVPLLVHNLYQHNHNSVDSSGVQISSAVEPLQVKERQKQQIGGIPTLFVGDAFFTYTPKGPVKSVAELEPTFDICKWLMNNTNLEYPYLIGIAITSSVKQSEKCKLWTRVQDVNQSLGNQSRNPIAKFYNTLVGRKPVRNDWSQLLFGTLPDITTKKSAAQFQFQQATNQSEEEVVKKPASNAPIVDNLFKQRKHATIVPLSLGVVQQLWQDFPNKFQFISSNQDVEKCNKLAPDNSFQLEQNQQEKQLQLQQQLSFWQLPCYWLSGVSVTLDTPQGVTEFHPLFLSISNLNKAIKNAKKLFRFAWLAQRKSERSRKASKFISQLAIGMSGDGYFGKGGPIVSDSEGLEEPPEVSEFLQELNENGVESGEFNGGSPLGLKIIMAMGIGVGVCLSKGVCWLMDRMDQIASTGVWGQNVMGIPPTLAIRGGSIDRYFQCVNDINIQMQEQSTSQDKIGNNNRNNNNMSKGVGINNGAVLAGSEGTSQISKNVNENKQYLQVEKDNSVRIVNNPEEALLTLLTIYTQVQLLAQHGKPQSMGSLLSAVKRDPKSSAHRPQGFRMQISVALKEDEQSGEQEGENKQLQSAFKQVDINLGFDMKQIKGEEMDCVAAREKLMDVQKGVLLIGDIGWDPESKQATPPPSYKAHQLAGERFLEIQYRQLQYPQKTNSNTITQNTTSSNSSDSTVQQ